MVQKEIRTMNEGGKIIVIAGPTATGKTVTAIKLAEKFNGEIINADSRQVYKYMDIGTAKPPLSERERIPHHIFDVVEPDKEFNAQLYRTLVEKTVHEIHTMKKHVFIVGGTGFYIKAYLEGLAERAHPDTAVRERLRRECREIGLSEMYRRLTTIDPGVTKWIHPNDRYRILRALEIYEVTGEPPSRFKKKTKKPKDVLYICLKLDRKVIYDNINKRVHKMLKDGLIEEVKALLDRGYSEELRPLQSHGYKEMIDYLKNRISLETAIERTQLRTRQYAKRQITWFRGVPYAIWLPPEKMDEIIKICNDFLEGKRDAQSAA